MANLRDRLTDPEVRRRILDLLEEDIRDTAAEEAEAELNSMEDDQLQMFLDLVDQDKCPLCEQLDCNCAPSPRRVHTEAVAAGDYDEQDVELLSCRVMGHDVLETREIIRVELNGGSQAEFALMAGDPQWQDLTGKDVLLRYVEGDQYATIVEVLP